MSAAAIVVAAGQGTRMRGQKNKVFLEVGGRSILEDSLALLESSRHIDEVVLVTRASDLDACESVRGRCTKLRAGVAGGDVGQSPERGGLQGTGARSDDARRGAIAVYAASRHTQ